MMASSFRVLSLSQPQLCPAAKTCPGESTYCKLVQATGKQHPWEITRQVHTNVDDQISIGRCIMGYGGLKLEPEDEVGM
ncbi:hypothetical protein BS17DRAFT_277512 [Gyrodon lividus]|nr:hypothetical protein BS17DRAFT_277512 [Gyrodon lividus]